MIANRGVGDRVIGNDAFSALMTILWILRNEQRGEN